VRLGPRHAKEAHPRQETTPKSWEADMAAAATAAPATSSGIASGAPAPLPSTAPGGGGGVAGGVGTSAQFREIHKNTWLKRLTADGKRLTVGPKVSGHWNSIAYEVTTSLVCRL